MERVHFKSSKQITEQLYFEIMQYNLIRILNSSYSHTFWVNIRFILQNISFKKILYAPLCVSYQKRKIYDY